MFFSVHLMHAVSGRREKARVRARVKARVKARAVLQESIRKKATKATTTTTTTTTMMQIAALTEVALATLQMKTIVLWLRVLLWMLLRVLYMLWVLLQRLRGPPRLSSAKPATRSSPRLFCFLATGPQ